MNFLQFIALGAFIVAALTFLILLTWTVETYIIDRIKNRWGRRDEG